MGGKNCVIVDADADLDDAVPALAYCAFGFAGQKCSAAARALVHERIADTLLERLHGAVEALLVDQAQRFGVDVPPVIERAARDRIDALSCRLAHEEGARVFQPGERARARPLRRPRGRSTGCRAARASPRRRSSARVLAVQRVASIDEACEIVSGQPFALTGGLFSRDPATVERVSAACRSATSTSTATSPARWSRASRSAATGCPAPARKAGGPDYLLHFVEPRVVTEDTMRHGLVV